VGVVIVVFARASIEASPVCCRAEANQNGMKLITIFYQKDATARISRNKPLQHPKTAFTH
jgi:hypothetical protein